MNRKRLSIVMAFILALSVTATAVAPEPAKLPQIKQPDLSKLTVYPVLRVKDGDTIVIRKDMLSITVRLIGVDTPGTVHPSKPVERYGREASRFTTNLLKGEHVYLDPDPQQGLTDAYGRMLTYIYRYPDGLFVNAEIIRQGYGHAYTKFPFKYMEEFRQLESFARQAEKGLWSKNVLPIEAKPPPPVRESPKIYTPSPKPKPEPASITVYVTRTGSKYHRGHCGYLRKSRMPMKLKDAKLMYGPCTRCRPPR